MITKNDIPVPTKKEKPGKKPEIEFGDIPIGEYYELDYTTDNKLNTIRASVSRYGKNKKMVFVTRKQNSLKDGIPIQVIRIWRKS